MIMKQQEVTCRVTYAHDSAPRTFIRTSKHKHISFHSNICKKAHKRLRIITVVRTEKTQQKVMETKVVVSSASFTPLTSLNSPQTINKRLSFALPSSVKPQPRGHNSLQRAKYLRLCPKAVQRQAIVPTSVPVRVAHELVLAGHRYLDVRTPEEFSSGHVEGAVNTPYMYRVGSGMVKNLKFVEQVSEHFGKYDEIVVGCKSGKRSMMAAADLLAAGFSAVTDIDGGYDAWTKNGLPTRY